MRLLFIVLTISFLLLQYRLWVGPGSLAQVAALKQQIASLVIKNNRDAERNSLMEAQIAELKRGLSGVEARARLDLGMIKQGETFYWFVAPNKERRE